MLRIDRKWKENILEEQKRKDKELENCLEECEIITKDINNEIKIMDDEIKNIERIVDVLTIIYLSIIINIILNVVFGFYI